MKRRREWRTEEADEDEEEDEDEVEGPPPVPGMSSLTFVTAPLTPLRSLWASVLHSSLLCESDEDYHVAFCLADFQIKRVLKRQRNASEFLFHGTKGNYMKIPSRNGWYRALIIFQGCARVVLKMWFFFYFAKGLYIVFYLKVRQLTQTTIESSAMNYLSFTTELLEKALLSF